MPSISTDILDNFLRQIQSNDGTLTSLDVSKELGLYEIDLFQEGTIDDELKAIAEALTDNTNLNIDEFVLSCPMYNVGQEGVVALAGLFLQNTTIKHIVLDNVRCTAPYGLRHLISALCFNRTVTDLEIHSDDEPSFDLDFEKTVLTQNCIVGLANVFRSNSVIQRVCLCPNGLTDDDVINILAPALAVNTAIVELDVSCNYGITEIGLGVLREAMGDRGVVIMDSGNDTDETFDETDSDDDDDEDEQGLYM